MQMLREQTGPSSFEGGGRNGRSGSQLSGPAPIIALPPQFRQDPRRLRRQVFSGCKGVEIMSLLELIFHNR